ncbi:MAG: (2Fe-2S)-binding protein [Tannerella sp.]|jgi:ferredoxin|nr:(2Fe-2S)-binding protein [Tannerella sp.]
MFIKLNNREIAVQAGETLIEIARRANIEIPSLCYSKEMKHKSSCMVCAVKDCKSGQIIPSCTTIATDGMEIDTECQEVVQTRTLSLELLLSDHRADCEAPCRVACPGNFDVAMMNRLNEVGKFAEALELMRDALVIPATLCYICNAPCEKICRKGDIDAPVAIREIKKSLVAKTDLNTISKPAPNGRKAAVAGSSPAALSAAYHLCKQGFEVTVFEKSAEILKPYIEAEKVPDNILQLEIEVIRRMGVKMLCNAQEPAQADFDLVVSPQTKSKQPARMVLEGYQTVTEKKDKRFNSSFLRFSDAEKSNISVQGKSSGCLYCDCAEKMGCRLRRFATEYNIKGQRYAKNTVSEALQRQKIKDGLWFEQAKCIKCGLCVYNSDNGFTFKNRGFKMKVILPEENAAHIDARLAEICPTGAIYSSEPRFLQD